MRYRPSVCRPSGIGLLQYPDPGYGKRRETCYTEERVFLSSHSVDSRFRLVPKSVTLDDLERPICKKRDREAEGVEGVSPSRLGAGGA